jgi:hypothetical protein
MAKRTPYQERAIRNYYQNQDQILMQRLGDLVTDLYLADGKNRPRLWKRAGEILEKFKVPKAEILNICQSDKPELLANVLKRILEKSS